MIIRSDEVTTKVHLSEIASVLLHTQRVYVSAYLLSELSKAKVPLIVSDARHLPVGQLLPLHGTYDMSHRIVAQTEWGEPVKKRVWQAIIREKVRQQSQLLLEYGIEEEARRIKAMIPDVKSGDTTNREGQAAAIYFPALFGAGFTRNMESPINSALDYGYTVLMAMTGREIAARGYLTNLGIFHHNQYNQFNLASDFMESFRPIVDRLVCDHVSDEFGKEERHHLTNLLNVELSYNGGTYRLASVLGLYVQDCLSALEKRMLPNAIRNFEMIYE